MGFKSVRVSDVSGKELADEEVVTVVVKTDGKVLDASADEVAKIKTVENLVQLEVRLPDGTTKELFCTRTEFHKVVSKKVLDNADSNRGRRSGYKPQPKASSEDDAEVTPPTPIKSA